MPKNSTPITIVATGGELRTMVRKSVDAEVSVTVDERRAIENEFIRLAQLRDRNSSTTEKQARVIALLDLVLARAGNADPNPDPDQTDDTHLRQYTQRLVRQARELLSDTHFNPISNAFVSDRAQEFAP